MTALGGLPTHLEFAHVMGVVSLHRAGRTQRASQGICAKAIGASYLLTGLVRLNAAFESRIQARSVHRVATLDMGVTLVETYK